MSRFGSPAAHPLLVATLAFGFCAAIALRAASSNAAEPQTPDQQRCTGAMNGDLLATSGAALGEIARCMSEGSKGKLAEPIEACAVGDDDGKLAKARGKADDDFARRCVGLGRKPPGAPKKPAFAVTDVDSADSAARSAAGDLFHALFGPDLDAATIAQATDRDAARCQQFVARDVRACSKAWLREFNACKRDGLKRKAAPFTSALELEGCMGSDPDGRIAKRCDRRELGGRRPQLDSIRQSLAKHCVAPGVELARAFPGCAADDPEATHACIAREVRCRGCLALSRADTLGRDCDALDDGAANASCVPSLGRSVCAFTPDSGFFFESAAGFLGGGLDGELTLDCGIPTGGAGLAPCRCALDRLTPVEVPGVGWACAAVVDGCSPGRVACAGGPSLDVAIRADHDLGSCASNAACAASCAASCAAGGAEPWSSACEGFCAGGASDGSACTADAQCPGGHCNGIAGGGHGHICQCQCVARSGQPSVPGGVQCDLGLRVRIESALPCDGADVVLDLGDRCLPITTETAQASLVDENAIPGRMLPAGLDLLGGLAVSCPALRAAGTSGMNFVAAGNAFDLRGAGDIYAIFSLACQ